MAFVGLVAGVSGDLNVAAYSYGYFDDVVLAVEDTGAFVRTCEGNDIIDYSRLTSSIYQWSLHSGSGDDTVYGGVCRLTVWDGSGNDKLFFGSDNDFAYAGSGNDVFDGGGGSDTITFEYISNDGFGPLIGSAQAVTVDLSKTTAQDLGIFGKDIIRNIENVYGGSGNDRLFGTAGNNTLGGQGGDDILIGRAGNDVLYSSSGADKMTGGRGADWLFGSFFDDFATDLFIYTSVRDSNAADGIDEVRDFVDGGGATDDRIDLSAIDANAAVAGNQKFQFIGTAAFDTTAKGQVRFETDGFDTYVYVDTDTDTNAEMTIIVRGLTSLTAADFIL